MATRELKQLPGGLDFPVKELFQSAVFAASAAQLTYLSTGANTIFSVPAYTRLLAITAVVDTAFAGGAAVGPEGIVVSDGTNTLMRIGMGTLATAGSYHAWLSRNYTSDTDITATLAMGGSASAGAVTFRILYRMSSGQQDLLK